VKQDSKPAPRPDPHYDPDNPWAPFPDRVSWELAMFLYTDAQMGHAKMDRLFDIWKASTLLYGGRTPFQSSADLLAHIDAVPYGYVPWQGRTMSYPGPKPSSHAPQWMNEKYNWYFRDPRLLALQLLANPDFDKRFDTAAYQEFKPNGSRRYKNFMSARFAWEQSVSVSPAWALLKKLIRNWNRSAWQRIRSSTKLRLLHLCGDLIRL
jgi:hypothetical protein